MRTLPGTNMEVEKGPSDDHDDHVPLLTGGLSTCILVSGRVYIPNVTLGLIQTRACRGDKNIHNM